MGRVWRDVAIGRAPPSPLRPPMDGAAKVRKVKERETKTGVIYRDISEEVTTGRARG